MATRDQPVIEQRADKFYLPGTSGRPGPIEAFLSDRLPDVGMATPSTPDTPVGEFYLPGSARRADTSSRIERFLTSLLGERGGYRVVVSRDDE